jgi:regulatory protein
MKKYTPSQAREKIRHYCAFQERSHLETRRKLFTYNLYASEVEEILVELITDGFLNEERYAKAYAGGKFRIKKWGRIKIIHELEAKGLSKNCIKAGLKELNEADYEETLTTLLDKKLELLAPEENLYARKDKAAKYAIQKGFEPDLVWRKLKELADKN